jgi:CBS domain-containing protein
MNVLFFLTPKNQVEFLYSDMTIRQALEKMQYHRYSMIPVISKETGYYLYSISEGDILWFLKDGRLGFDELEKKSLSLVTPHRQTLPVGATSDVKDLYEFISAQNYVPVIDDQKRFIGIVTRKSVIDELLRDLSAQK